MATFDLEIPDIILMGNLFWELGVYWVLLSSLCSKYSDNAPRTLNIRQRGDRKNLFNIFAKVGRGGGYVYKLNTIEGRGVLKTYIEREGGK